MRIFDSKRALRLMAPLAFVLVVGGTGLVATTASADKKLPTRTPEELLVDVQQAKLTACPVRSSNAPISAFPPSQARMDKTTKS
jgi:hypothetical protein